MKHAIFLPPTGELADPSVFRELAPAAEAAGWDGLFLWDHVLRSPDEPGAVADPWICFAVAAMSTNRIRLGPMVTPVTRRRPLKLAREAIGIDQLSGGRLTLGLGLGVDRHGELSRLGDVVDAKIRGQRLDEGIELLKRFWTGDPVTFEGEHFVADGVTILPTPVQQPHPPMWFAARGDARKPVRRAAKHQGLFPVDVDVDQLGAMMDLIAEERGTLDGFDVAVRANSADEYRAFADTGATWMLTPLDPGITRAEAMEVAAMAPTVFFGV